MKAPRIHGPLHGGVFGDFASAAIGTKVIRELNALRHTVDSVRPMGRYLVLVALEFAACLWRHWFINSASAAGFIP